MATFGRSNISKLIEDDKKEQAKREKELQAEREKEELERRKQSREARINVLRTLAIRLRSNRRRYRKKKDEEWDRIIRVRTMQLCCFSLIGLLASVFMSYFKWNERCWAVPDALTESTLHSVCDPALADPDDPRSRNPTNPTAMYANITTATFDNSEKYPVTFFFIVAGQVVLTFSTIISFILLAQLYKLKLMERRREWSGFTEIDLIDDDGEQTSREKQELFRAAYSFWKSNLRWQFAVELFVHFVHPMTLLETRGPFWQTVYEVSEAFIFLRLYLLFQVLYINSNIYQFRHDIIASRRELTRTGFEISAISTAKILFYKFPERVVVGLTMTAIGVFGFWMYVVERGNNAAFNNLTDCFWFVWVSLSTIGYGDMFAETTTGRIVVMVIAIVSFFITTVFAGIVTNLLSPTREQKYVSSYLQQRHTDLEYKKAAVAMIVAAYRERRRKESQRVQDAFSDRRSPEMYAAIKRLRNARLMARESVGHAEDPVMDQKLQRAIFQTYQLDRMLDDQAKRILKLENMLMRSVALIKAKASDKGKVKGASAAVASPLRRGNGGAGAGAGASPLSAAYGPKGSAQIPPSAGMPNVPPPRLPQLAANGRGGYIPLARSP